MKTGIPEKWQERFVIKRINQEDIEVSLAERNAIILSLEGGARFIQVGKYTLMLNSISSIDPLWGAKNIPPRPREITDIIEICDGKATVKVQNQSEIDEWDKLFSNRELHA